MMIQWNKVPKGTKLSVRKRDRGEVTYSTAIFNEYDEQNGLVFVMSGKGQNLAYRERDCRIYDDKEFIKYRVSYEDFIAGKTSNVERIALEVAELVNRKNNDYNNSFEDRFNEYGWTAFNIRLSDKLGRIKNLTEGKQDAQIKSESVEDTIKDIIGYSLLMLDVLERTGA